jgi:predicted DNA-binding protein
MPKKQSASIKVWVETKQILDHIRIETGQTMAELIDELARERLDKVRDDIKKTIG